MALIIEECGNAGGWDSVQRGQFERMSVRDAARLLRHKQTPAEVILWQALRSRAVGNLRFRRQQPFGRFIADFYCHEARLIVELDGAFHTQPDQAAHDQIRDETLRSLELEILRIPNGDVLSNLPGTLERIVAVCRARIEIVAQRKDVALATKQ